MRLLLVPLGQSIDYDYPLTLKLGEKGTVLSLLLVLAVAGGGLWLLTRAGGRRLGLAAVWFFVPLLPSSSVFPIRDLIYEHRLYLSVVGFSLLTAGGLAWLVRQAREKAAVWGAGLLAVYFILTMLRSSVWASELRLWEDAWSKAPNKARTNKNYGFLLSEAGRFEEGVVRLERAVELKPNDQDYRITLGGAYLRSQQWEKAREQFDKAVQLRPDKADGWNNLGVALFKLEKFIEAKQAFETAIARNEQYQIAWLGLGGAEIMLGNVAGAVGAVEQAIELMPEDTSARSNLVAIYIRAKQWPEALAALGELERLAPASQDARVKRQVIEMGLAGE